MAATDDRGELEALWRRLLEIGKTVNASLDNCVEAISGPDLTASQRIEVLESEVNELSKAAEGEAHRLFEHVDLGGQDLRFVMRSLKIITDLERISDECHSLAIEIPMLSSSAKHGPVATGLVGQARTARSMVREALRALEGLDVGVSQTVVAMDEEADRAHRHVYREIRDRLVGRPGSVDELIASQKISRALERVSDHAVNIAEDTLFIAIGQRPDERPVIGNA